MADDVITRDENGNLAVRTVSATESDTTSQYDDLYARTSDGKRALRVVGAAGGGTGGLPDQTGNAGKFLTTDGTDASWGDALVNNATADNSLMIGFRSGPKSETEAVAIGVHAYTYYRSVAIGSGAQISYYTSSDGIALGFQARVNARGGISIGSRAIVGVGAKGAIQINTSPNTATNNVPNTFKIANENGNFELMSADGTIPSERLAALPTDNGTYVLKATVTDGTVTTMWVAE